MNARHRPARSTARGPLDAFILAFSRALFAIAVVALVFSSLARAG